MVDRSVLESEIAEILVEALDLEEVSADEIDPEEVLFGEGLGLDSIDALEIALAISQRYGVQMKAEDEQTREAFANIRSLAKFIADARA